MDDDGTAIFTMTEGYFGAKMGAQLLFQLQDFWRGSFARFRVGLFAAQFADQVFRLADVETLLDDGLQDGSLALLGGKRQNCATMTFGDLVISQGLLDNGEVV